MSTATIRAADLPLVLFAAKLRRYNQGRTCQLCALSAEPLIAVSCADERTRRERMQAHALRMGTSPARVSPLQRGDISLVVERTQRQHGSREVQRTWGAGVRALRAEPRHVLNGGWA